MRIKIIQSFITSSGAVNAGESFECPDEKALELINTRRAVALAQTPAVRMEQPSRGPLAELRTAAKKAAKGARK